MSGMPQALWRLLLALVALAIFAAPSAFTLWVSTPAADDVQQRVMAVTDSHQVNLLMPDQVPTLLADAVVAAEDERFYSHHGVDSIGLGRAILYDASNFCLCQGGSTITEQLVKDVYLDGSDRGYNKMEDIVLALKVERVIDKQQILADYLSEINTGFGRWGVTAAACAYFHAPLGSLTLAQYALLAGVTQAPAIYDPTINPDLAKARREEVLESMQSDRYISADEVTAANAEAVLTTGPGC